jgi:hypothetical protein
MAEIHKKIVLTKKQKARVEWEIWECRIGDRISQRLWGRDWVIASMKRRYRADRLSTVADEDDNV